MIVLPLVTVCVILLVVYFYLKCDLTNECANPIEPVNNPVPTPTPVEQSQVKTEPVVSEIKKKTKKAATKKTSKKKKK